MFLKLAASRSLDRLKQPFGMGRIPQEVGGFGHRVVIVLRHDDHVPVSRHNFYGGVVVVDLLDESEQGLTRAGDRASKPGGSPLTGQPSKHVLADLVSSDGWPNRAGHQDCHAEQHGNGGDGPQHPDVIPK